MSGGSSGGGGGSNASSVVSGVAPARSPAAASRNAVYCSEGGAGGRVDGGAVVGGAPVGDHPVEQLRGHPAVAAPGGGARVTPAQAVHVGEGRQQLAVSGLLFGVRSEDFAQGADLLEGTGAGEGVGRVRPACSPAARARSSSAVPAGSGVNSRHRPGPSGPSPRTARTLPSRSFAVPASVVGAYTGRPVRLATCWATGSPRDLRLLPGLAGEQHQRPALVPVLRPGLEDLAELDATDLDGGVRGVVRAEGDRTGCAVADEVVGAALGSGAGEGGRRAGEDGAVRAGPRRSRAAGVRPRWCAPRGSCPGRAALTARAACRAVLGRALRDGHRPHGNAGLRSGRALRHEAPEFAEGNRLPVERGHGGPGGGGRRHAGVAARAAGGDRRGRGVARVRGAVQP